MQQRMKMGRTDWILVGLALISFLAVCLQTGAIHDYAAYEHHWEMLLAGVDPWGMQFQGEAIQVNAYGPLHLVPSLVYALHPLGPKFVFVGITFVIFALLLDEERQANTPRAGAPLWRSPTFFFLLSPLTIIYVACFGSNDILVALSVALAARFRGDARYGWVGVALGLGALVKFYPLLFVPFFMIDSEGRMRVRGFLTALAVFLVGLSAAMLIWGETALSPLTYASGREPKMLSLLRFLDPASQRIGAERLVDFALQYNSVFVVAVATLWSLYSWLARLHWKLSATLGILFVLMSYKVGHPHFYLAWTTMFAFLCIDHNQERGRTLQTEFSPIAIFLGGFSAVLFCSGHFSDNWYLHGRWYVLRQVSSLLMAGVVAWSVYKVRQRICRPLQRDLKLAL